MNSLFKRKVLFNMTDSRYDLERFASRNDLEELMMGFDGIELMHLDEDDSGLLTPDMVVGYHMTQPEYWMDFWRGNMEQCLREFDTLENLRAHYHGDTPQALVNLIRKEYETAVSYGAEYVVIHVSNANIYEEISGQYRESDADVVDAFSELVNEAIPCNITDSSPWLLMENMWQPGLNFIDPKITARLLESVRYPKKGVMFDTGHLMHTEPGLRSQKEAVQFIHKKLDEHKDLCSYIKGVHLHQSLTGALIKRYQKNPPVLAKTYEERIGQLFEYIFKVDLHKPFVGQGVAELIDRINPQYMTFEFISESLAQHRSMLRRQQAVFRKRGPGTGQ